MADLQDPKYKYGRASWKHNPADLLLIAVLLVIFVVLVAAWTAFSPETVSINLDASALYKASGIVFAAVMVGILFWRATDLHFLRRRLDREFDQLMMESEGLEAELQKYLDEPPSRDDGPSSRPTA